MAYSGALMVTKSGGYCETVGQMGLVDLRWSSSRGRKPPIPNLRCLAAISDLGKGFGSKSRREIRSWSP